MKKLFIFLLLLAIFLTSCNIFRLKHAIFIPPSTAKLEQKLENTQTSTNTEHFAVLVAGNSENYHKNNLSLAYQILIEQGYNRKHIFILDSDGGDPANFPITDILTRKTFKMLFKWLQNNVKKEDTLLIYFTGHGTLGGFQLQVQESFSRSDFFQILTKIKPKLGIMVTDFCYWGTFKMDDYVFISATDNKHTSFGTLFGRSFWKAFRLDDNMTVLKAYEYAVRKDPGTKKGLNRPNITSKNINPDVDLFGLTLEK